MEKKRVFDKLLVDSKFSTIYAVGVLVGFRYLQICVHFFLMSCAFRIQVTLALQCNKVTNNCIKIGHALACILILLLVVTTTNFPAKIIVFLSLSFSLFLSFSQKELLAFAWHLCMKHVYLCMHGFNRHLCVFLGSHRHFE